jgi:hypothetical protein
MMRKRERVCALCVGAVCADLFSFQCSFLVSGRSLLRNDDANYRRISSAMSLIAVSNGAAGSGPSKTLRTRGARVAESKRCGATMATKGNAAAPKYTLACMPTSESTLTAQQVNCAKASRTRGA